MKKRFFISCIFILFISFNVFSQKESSMLRPKNLIYGEGGGNAIGKYEFGYSVNYARIFTDSVVTVCLRGGAEILPWEEGNEYQFPVEGSMLFGKKRHYFELGFGLTVYSHVIWPHISPGGAYMGIEPYSERINGINGCARIGYCFIPLNKNNLMFRIAFTPLYLNRYTDNGAYEHGKILPWGGISIGYAF